MSPTFRSLHNANYRIYAAGGLVSNTGTWMQRVAQDWLVLQLSGNSAAALGITTGLQFLPFFLAPYAGLIADRMPKRRLLQLTNLAMALPAAVLGSLAVSGAAQTWHVYVLAFVLGIGAVFDGPARQSFVSEIVTGEDLPNAIGLNSASFNAARLIGPGLAGLLIAALGGGVSATGWVILFNAVSYAAPILALSRMDPAWLHPAPVAERGPGMVREGFAYVRRTPELIFVFVLVFFTGTFGLNFQMTSALMATEIFHKGAGDYGMLGSILAIGSLTGALIAARRSAPSKRVLVGAAVGFGAVEIAAGLMPTYWWFALICPFLGLTALTVITSANSFVQLTAEAGMRGRVMALYLMVFMGGTPFGAPVIGWIGQTMGARWTLILGGAGTIVGAVGAAAWLLARPADAGAGAGSGVGPNPAIEQTQRKGALASF